eukprot:COSAG02_NODE_48146_length_336_cov_0.582278_1_plen_37_part_10
MRFHSQMQPIKAWLRVSSYSRGMKLDSSTDVVASGAR